MQFLMVYIREAHAIDSASPMGGKGHPIVEDPTTQAERNAVAAICMTSLALEEIPAVVDNMRDEVNAAYGGWPDRLYLIDREGHVAHKSGRGPAGFKPDQLESAILKVLGD